MCIPIYPRHPVSFSNAGGTGSDGGSSGPPTSSTGTAGARPEAGQQQQQQHAEGEQACSWKDIKSVQNLIERCLNKFMTQTEIIAALQVKSL